MRDGLGLRPGDEIEFVKDNGEYKVRRVASESPFKKWHGYLRELKRRDIDEVIEEMRGR